MRIDNSNILLSSQRSYTETDEERVKFRFWVNPRETRGDTVSISVQAKNRHMIDEDNNMTGSDLEMDGSLRKLIVELLVGHKLRSSS